MKLTRKQSAELEAIRYFIPDNYEHQPVQERDVERFFAWSDRGVDGEGVKREAMQTNTGLSALYWGKQRRDLQVTSYLEDWGSTVTAIDFVHEPRPVVEWLSDAMGKPGVLTMWVLHNKPDDLTPAQRNELRSLGVFREPALVA